MFKINALVNYSTIRSGQVKGKIIGKGRDILGEYVMIKVTSKTNPTYPLGYEFPVCADTPWLTLR